MKRRIAQKIFKSKELLKYSDRQLAEAEKIINKLKPKKQEQSKEN